VSLEPPLVSLCLRHESRFLADLLAAGRWALSILEGGEDATAARFARDRPARALALAELAASAGERTGALVLDGHAWLECELAMSFDVGDHKMLIGQVVSVNLISRDRPALAFLHGGYHALPPASGGLTVSQLVTALAVTAPAAPSRPAAPAAAQTGVTR
jgi:flavin reductase (DIM6/NTAB) family NADH-FMN oxidoreductase RutF